jgi:hypothetical protein
MKTTRGNLADIVAFYMEDNEIEYLQVRASVASNGEDIKISIIEDLEDDI